MAKLTLSDLVNLQNEASAVATINSNNTATETALENTLSRDGSSPNAMEADLDMNDKRILNLPQPVSLTEPLRLQDLDDFNGSTVNITNNIITVDNITSLPGLSVMDDEADTALVFDTSAGVAKTVLGKNFGFTQTGGSLRTLQGKLKESWISVLDFIPEAEHATIKDFTSNTDVSGFINNAINSLTKGGIIFFPEGRYTITSSIGANAMSGITFKGSGGRDLTYSGTKGTVIRFTGTGSGNIVTMTDSKGIWWEDIQVCYTSNSFTGTFFNCASTFTTGTGSGFKTVQLYQITNVGHTAGQGFYVKNCVDLVFDDVYISHAAFGWIGLFDGDATAPINETNVIRLYNCTTIALVTAAIVNPIVGWSCYSCNFELGDGNIPAGILCTGAHNVTNLNLYGCIFADSTAAGTWINMPVSIFNFNMTGGALLTNNVGTGTGIILGAGGKSVTGVNIQGVLFSGLSIGINAAVAGIVGSIVGNNFLNTTTALSNPNNLDPTTIVQSNNGLASKAIAATAGGTGQTGYTIGDILVASGATTLAKVVAPATGNTLISQGASVQPIWGKIGINTHVDNTTVGPAIIYVRALGVNMNSIADTTFNINLPTGFTRYRVQAVGVFHASADLTAATTVQYGLFTASGGGGTAVVAITASTVSSTAESTNNNAQFLGTAITASLNNSQLFFRVTTAHGSAATADVYLQYVPLP